MHVRIVTTITTLVDIDTLIPEHSVDVNSDGELPAEVVAATVTGACNGVIKSLAAQYPRLAD